MDRSHVEIQIDRLGLEGQGVGYGEGGAIYFVPGAVPGDRVLASYLPTPKRYRDATLEKVLVPSPDRRAPPCQFAEECGGCDFLHLEYSAQLRAKQAIVHHVLERGHLVPPVFHPIVASPREMGYRNRIQLRSRAGEVGFFRRRTHDIVSIHECKVATPRLNEAIETLRKELKNSPETKPQKVELWEMPEGRIGRLYDAPHGAAGFTQVNTDQNLALKNIVGEYVRSVTARKVLELFSGDGNLTEAYAEHVQQILALDSSRPAIEKARANPILQQKQTQFMIAEVRPATASKLPAEFKNQYDTLVLDPPRSGAGPGLEFFLHSKLQHIIYVSCSPLTFSLDAQLLRKRGYALRQVQPLDMFPNTRHIELVALLSSSSPC